jgi:hypothetical protein
MLLSIVFLPLMAHAFPATGHGSWIEGQEQGIAFRVPHLQLQSAFVLHMTPARSRLDYSMNTENYQGKYD